MRRLTPFDIETKVGKLTIEAYTQGYSVTDGGRLLTPNGMEKEVKLCKSAKYPSFKVTAKHSLGLGRSIHVHRFAAYCFYGDEIFDPSLQVRHLDGNVLNFSKFNIRLGTARDNAYDKPAEVRLRSSRAGTAASLLVRRMFSEAQVREIRSIQSEGLLSYHEIASMYGNVDESTIRKICNRQRYKEII